MKRSNSNMSMVTDIPLIIEDRQIRVSIYAFTRSLRKKRGKMNCKHFVLSIIRIYVKTKNMPPLPNSKEETIGQSHDAVLHRKVDRVEHSQRGKDLASGTNA